MKEKHRGIKCFFFVLPTLIVVKVFLFTGPFGCVQKDTEPPEKAEEKSTTTTKENSEGPPELVSKLKPGQIGVNKEIPGLFQNYSRFAKRRHLTDEQKEEIAKLESIGYLSGSQKAPEEKGITLHNKEKAYEGFNLYTSGHAGEAILIDMEGNLLHRWKYDFWKFMPDFKITNTSHAHVFWRRAHLYPNGDLLAIYEGICMIKLDKDSKLIWGYKGKPHHDIFVNPDGRIYTLTRQGVLNTKYHAEKPLLEDFVTILDKNGKEIKQVSILTALENSKYSDIITQRMKTHGDVLHTNSVQVLDGSFAKKSPVFKKGNVLTSICYLSFIGIIDMDEEIFVWGMNSPFKLQHQPILMKNGHMLLFDNQGGNPKYGRSRIMEFDPLNGELFWLYEGTENDPFFSYNCGTMQRLPNGNTLISESTTGRAFEVTSDKEKVWEFINPHRAGDQGQFIANLLEMERFGSEFPFDWMEKKGNKTR